MKSPMILAASLALALTAPVFAQNSSQMGPGSATTDQAAPADSQSPNSDASQPRSSRHHHSKPRQASQQYNPAAERLTGDEPGTAAYQASDREKTFPAVDRAHVPGDPPIIDHSADKAPVQNPTTTTITIPPTH
ncbi:MAG TPA: hypothetical protein VK660_04490 [Xanthomonadaceae bacterium]|nr:hypothetical protein [Xanthomonadaceae bacterium]